MRSAERKMHLLIYHFLPFCRFRKKECTSRIIGKGFNSNKIIKMLKNVESVLWIDSISEGQKMSLNCFKNFFQIRKRVFVSIEKQGIWGRGRILINMKNKFRNTYFTMCWVSAHRIFFLWNGKGTDFSHSISQTGMPRKARPN